MVMSAEGSSTTVGTEWPTVSVVVPTKDRPQMLERALRAIVAQDYAGDLEVIVVFDGTEPELPSIDLPEGRGLRALVNNRRPGLAGNRNTGYLDATGVYVAACDDDDVWFPDKLTRQIALLSGRPDACGAGAGSVFHFEGTDTERPAELADLTFDELLHERHAEVHASTYVFERLRLLEEIGLVDEELPAGYGEDSELLLRATRLGPLVCVQEPLIRAYMHRSSFFADRWRNIDEALEHLIAKVPEFQSAPRGLARMEGQRAFAKAAVGDRREARRMARSALRRNKLQRQAWAALIVSTGLLSADRVLTLARRFGKGI